MAPKASRFHPYRATSDVETPGGTQPCSWFAGPGLLPAGIDPPPDRPILIIVDYSPLQSLAHPSERDHAIFSALANHNFRCATAGELEALFTWARLFPTDEANSIICSLTTTADNTTSYSMGHSYDHVGLEFRYADLTGDVFQVREDWTILQLLDEYRPECNYMESSFLVPGSQQPFILRLTCHKVRQGFILPSVSAHRLIRFKRKKLR